jgi:hypothetical protein
MTVLLILWVVSVLGLIGTVWFRSWQITRGAVDPMLIDPEHENPLSLTRIEWASKKFFTAFGVTLRTFFIRLLHALALFMHRTRVKLDGLVRKMVARIEHEEGVLEANRTSEQFLSTINEYKQTLRNTAQEVREEVTEKVTETRETFASVAEAVKKPMIRRKRKPKVTPIEEIPPTEITEEIPKDENTIQ